MRIKDEHQIRSHPPPKERAFDHFGMEINWMDPDFWSSVLFYFTYFCAYGDSKEEKEQKEKIHRAGVWEAWVYNFKYLVWIQSWQNMHHLNIQIEWVSEWVRILRNPHPAAGRFSVSQFPRYKPSTLFAVLNFKFATKLNGNLAEEQHLSPTAIQLRNQFYKYVIEVLRTAGAGDQKRLQRIRGWSGTDFQIQNDY